VVAIRYKVKNIGKPYAGKPHVRFDERGLGKPVPYSTSDLKSRIKNCREEGTE
jgi:hypothetical protein